MGRHTGNRVPWATREIVPSPHLVKPYPELLYRWKRMEAPQQQGRSSEGTGGDRAGPSSSWEDQAMEALRAQRVDKPQVQS